MLHHFPFRNRKRSRLESYQQRISFFAPKSRNNSKWYSRSNRKRRRLLLSARRSQEQLAGLYRVFSHWHLGYVPTVFDSSCFAFAGWTHPWVRSDCGMIIAVFSTHPEHTLSGHFFHRFPLSLACQITWFVIFDYPSLPYFEIICSIAW